MLTCSESVEDEEHVDVCKFLILTNSILHFQDRILPLLTHTEQVLDIHMYARTFNPVAQVHIHIIHIFRARVTAAKDHIIFSDFGPVERTPSTSSLPPSISLPCTYDAQAQSAWVAPPPRTSIAYRSSKSINTVTPASAQR
jgi:hypothetical protein